MFAALLVCTVREVAPIGGQESGDEAAVRCTYWHKVFSLPQQVGEIQRVASTEAARGDDISIANCVDTRRFHTGLKLPVVISSVLPNIVLRKTGFSSFALLLVYQPLRSQREILFVI
jgi:hypothetical protein